MLSRICDGTNAVSGGGGFGGRSTTLYPWHGTYCGDLDLAGFRKPVSHYRNITYAPGKLRAAGLQNGRKVAESLLTTAMIILRG